MAINQLTTANTFTEWLTATSSLIAVANNLTDNTNGGFLANSAIFIEGAAASLNVRTLANINTLTVNTANIANVLVSSSNVSIPLDLIVGRNANLIGNVASVNVTNRLFVGGDSFIYGNLTISGNVTLDAVGFDDLEVSGSANIANSVRIGQNLTVSGATSLAGNLVVGNLSVTQAFTGAPNTAIYNYIAQVRTEATSAGTYANGAFIHANSSYFHSNSGFNQANSSYNSANAAFVHANSSFIQANAASDQAVAFAIALG
jgi:hypothetical protein